MFYILDSSPIFHLWDRSGHQLVKWNSLLLEPIVVMMYLVIWQFGLGFQKSKYNSNVLDVTVYGTFLATHWVLDDVHVYATWLCTS